MPLIIQGENPGLTLGTSLTGVGKDSDALKANQQQTLSTGWKEYLKIDGINEKDLLLFYYEQENLRDKGIKGIWLQYFLKEWTPKRNAEFSIKNGFKIRSKNFDPSSIGTYLPYFQLDSDLVQVNQMLKNIKFGFGQCMDHVCYDIRDGYLSRSEAVDLVLKYDGKCSIDYITKFCDYIGISINQFWETVEKFRGDMWYKNSQGEWKNKISDELRKIA